MPASLEHVNFTVQNPDKTGKLLCGLFDWEIRWAGPSLNGGRTVHVGSATDYVAIYSPKDAPKPGARETERNTNMNHIGVVVDDLDDVEKRVIAAGLTPLNHGNYEPGRRFYFFDHNGVEFEVVSYK